MISIMLNLGGNTDMEGVMNMKLGTIGRIDMVDNFDDLKKKINKIANPEGRFAKCVPQMTHLWYICTTKWGICTTKWGIFII